MATLYVVRHGHIERNGRFIGRTDLPLSPLGHDQARRLGRLLSHISFDRCFSSPLVRSLETARHILAENSSLNQPGQKNADAKQSVKAVQKDKGIGVAESTVSEAPKDTPSATASCFIRTTAGNPASPKDNIVNNEFTTARSDSIDILPELIEISLGLWEGKTKAEVMERYPLVWKERGTNPTTIAPPQGENYSMLYERMVPVFQTLSSFKGKENVLVVAHRSVGQVLMGHFSHFPFEVWAHLAMPYGSVTLCPLYPLNSLYPSCPRN